MNLVVLLITVLILFFSPLFSFAATRLDVINTTLTEIETDKALTTTKVLDSYRVAERHIPKPQEHRKTPKDYEEEVAALKKRKAVDQALSVSIGFDRNHIHYSEWESGDKLDEDYGYEDGLYASIGYKSPNYHALFFGRPFLEAYFRKYSDVINYKGATTGGAPFNCDQKSVITRYGAKLGSYVDLIKDVETYLYVDMGKRKWNRGENEVISGVTCYKETYEWAYYGVGAGINYFVIPRLSLGIDWAGWLAIDPKMKAYLYEGGTFKLGNVWGTEVKAPIKYYLLKSLSLDVTPYYTYWHISHSNSVVISGTSYYEPDSNTNELGVMAGITYGF
jgi:hypothetical protein